MGQRFFIAEPLAAADGAAKPVFRNSLSISAAAAAEVLLFDRFSNKLATALPA